MPQKKINKANGIKFEWAVCRMWIWLCMWEEQPEATEQKMKLSFKASKFLSALKRSYPCSDVCLFTCENEHTPRGKKADDTF